MRKAGCSKGWTIDRLSLLNWRACEGGKLLTGDTNTNIIVIDETKTVGLDKSQ
jgi:hypothetical protein